MLKDVIKVYIGCDSGVNKKRRKFVFYFDVRHFIKDCGGPSAASSITGKVRGAVYGWLTRGRLGSDDLAKLKGAHPDLDLNRYVKCQKTKNE